MNIQTSYCPRCDRAFVAPVMKLARKLMEAHLKKAHPDYYFGMYVDDDETP